MEPGMTSARTTTITLRVSHHTLAAIDDAAKRAGRDRNGYILSWIPENYSTRWYDAKVRGEAQARAARAPRTPV
jgi:hypothetical protein